MLKIGGNVPSFYLFFSRMGKDNMEWRVHEKINPLLGNYYAVNCSILIHSPPESYYFVIKSSGAFQDVLIWMPNECIQGRRRKDKSLPLTVFLSLLTGHSRN